MKRFGAILILLSVLTLCLQGCGDKEKGEAMARWAAFQAEEIEKIQASFDAEEQKPFDFQQKLLEVEDLPYRFKGLISFRRGSVFQEQSYAFIDGSWTPVKYVGPKDKKAEKARQQKMEGIEEEIRELTKEIEKEEKALAAYQQRLEQLETKKSTLETLQAELEELKADE